MKEKTVLDKFGQLLVEGVRDQTIDKYDDIESGKLKSAEAINSFESLSNFNSDQKETIRNIVINSIDDALHNFLWLFEQNEDELSIEISAGENAKSNLNHISDGLTGELYSEDGWLAKHSKHKHQE